MPDTPQQRTKKKGSCLQEALNLVRQAGGTHTHTHTHTHTDVQLHRA